MLMRSPATYSAAMIRESVSSRRLIGSMTLRDSKGRSWSSCWHDAVAMFSLVALVGITAALFWNV